MTVTKRVDEFAHLLGQCCRTNCRAVCYQITRRGKSVSYSKTGHYLESDCFIRVMSLSSVKNGDGSIVLARARTLLGDQSEVWIWVGDMRR